MNDQLISSRPLFGVRVLGYPRSKPRPAVLYSRPFCLIVNSIGVPFISTENVSLGWSIARGEAFKNRIDAVRLHL
jgi:hypothetical protein